MKQVVGKINCFFAGLADVVILLNRVVIGFVFVSAGWGKVNNLSRVIAFFDSLNIPLAVVQAPMVAGFELVGGALIILGFMTRIASVLLSFIMLVAIIAAKMSYISGLNTLFGLSEFLYMIMLLMLVGLGAGKISLDNKFKC